MSTSLLEPSPEAPVVEMVRVAEAVVESGDGDVESAAPAAREPIKTPAATDAAAADDAESPVFIEAQMRALQVKDKFDAMDDTNRWAKASVAELQADGILVRYFGFAAKYDKLYTWAEFGKLAPVSTRSLKKNKPKPVKKRKQAAAPKGGKKAKLDEAIPEVEETIGEATKDQIWVESPGVPHPQCYIAGRNLTSVSCRWEIVANRRSIRAVQHPSSPIARGSSCAPSHRLPQCLLHRAQAQSHHNEHCKSIPPIFLRAMALSPTLSPRP
jgi:hypothetical protein